MTKLKPRNASARRTRSLLALLIAACFTGAGAVPTSPTVVAGQATFSQQGNVFSITNTPNTVINWQSFSINAGDITRFIQQSADSAVLNRITGQDPSRILGALQSNGHVFLINPNGILFGKDARVDVNGLTASTLKLSDADFLAGKNNFGGGRQAGAIVNQGQIATPSGGKVFLIASDVTNSGIITSPQGQVVLAAGHSVQLADSGNPDLQVVVSAPPDQAINLGQVIAQGGRVGIYGALVSQRGVVNAHSAQVGANGKIVLKASRDAMLEAGSVTSATGAGTGGQVTVEGRRVGVTGDARIDASGQLGGGTVLLGGGYQGRNAALANAQQTLLGKNASVKADAIASGNGGTVVLWSDGGTRAAGTISARGGAASGNGGLVETSGKHLDVDGITVSAGAAHGASGTWLLDPTNIEITTTGTAGLSNADQFSDSGSNTQIHPNTIGSVLPDTNVVLQATSNVVINAAINPPVTSGSLTIDAGNNIDVNAAVTTAGGAITLTANHPSYATGTGAVNLAAGASISSGSGALTMRGAAVNLLGTVSSGSFVDITANSVNLSGLIGPSGGVRPLLSFSPATAGNNIEVRASGTGSALMLDPNRLKAFDVSQIVLGRSSMTGDIVVYDGYGGGLANSLTLNTQGAVSILAPITLPAGSNSTLLVDIDGNAQKNVAVKGALTADNVVINAPNMSIEAAITGSGTAGTITLTPNQLSSQIQIGAGAADGAGVLGLDDTEVNKLKASSVEIGGAVGASGAVKVMAGGANFSLMPQNDSIVVVNAREANLTLEGVLQTAGTLYLKGNHLQTTGAGKAKSAALYLASTFGIGTDPLDSSTPTPAVPFQTETGFLSATNNRAGGMAGIRIQNGIQMQLANVNQTGSGNIGDIDILNNGGMTLLSGNTVSTGGTGAVWLATMSPLTIEGTVSTVDGPISLTAGNGGLLTIGSSGVVQSGSGSISLTAGDIVNNGSVSTSSGSISVVANTVTGGGSFSPLPSNLPPPNTPPTPVPVPPTVSECVANSTLDGCTAILQAALTSCIANPAGPDCAIVLPSLSVCIASPATPGCSVVLPSLSTCVANPAAAGCSVVLPSLATCVATPSAPGCSVVLPTLSACIATPSAPGCSVVLPTLSACIATPSAPGCSVVLPTLSTCIATPSAPGCSVVLPTLPSCIATPSAPGCSVVLPSIQVCIGDKTIAGCSVVLPTLPQCVLAPSTLGCSVVLPSLSQCVALPSTAGCSVVLPSLAQCIANPAVAGCSAVLPTLSQCVATPALPGCSVVLPTLAQCIASPTLQGCSVVLPSLAQCVATPSLQGCQAVLPPVSACVANPTAPGCQVVVPPVNVPPAGKLADAVNTTVTALNASTNTVLPTKVDGVKKDDKLDLPAPSEGEKIDIRKKTYCN